MGKKAEGGMSMWVIGLVLALIVFFVWLAMSGELFGNAQSGITYDTLETQIRMCAAQNNRVEIPGLETDLTDKDNDDFPDSCDICLGMGVDLGNGLGRDGDNSKDYDNDFYPDSCDSDKANSDEHECIYQLCIMNDEGDCEEYLDQCCTALYGVYLQQSLEESGAGATRYKCDPIS